MLVPWRVNQHLSPWRLTWNIIMEVWKIIFLSNWVICRFHVNLPGCMMSSWSVFGWVKWGGPLLDRLFESWGIVCYINIPTFEAWYQIRWFLFLPPFLDVNFLKVMFRGVIYKCAYTCTLEVEILFVEWVYAQLGHTDILPKVKVWGPKDMMIHSTDFTHPNLVLGIVTLQTVKQRRWNSFDLTTSRIHVYYIYPHLVEFQGKCMGKYTIHGSYAVWFKSFLK